MRRKTERTFGNAILILGAAQPRGLLRRRFLRRHAKCSSSVRWRLSDEIKELTKKADNATGTEETRLKALVKTRQKVINKLYRSVPLDPKFAEQDREHRRVYLGELIADPDLLAASQKGTWSSGKPPETDKVRLLQSTIKKQFDVPFKDLKKKVDGKGSSCPHVLSPSS